MAEVVTIHKPTSGNRTDKRGSRYVQNIHINKAAAQSIKILLLALGRSYTPGSVAAWVEEQAEAGWRAYDAEIQAAVETHD